MVKAEAWLSGWLVFWLLLAGALAVSGCRLQTESFPDAPVLGGGGDIEKKPAPEFSGSVLAQEGTDLVTTEGIDGSGLDGSDLALADLRGSPVVLNFWASWCGPCREEQPGLERIWQKYKGQGVQFLGINFRDTEANARAYMDEFKVTYPSIFNPPGDIAHQYTVAAVPTTVLIDKEGQMVGRWPGAISEKELEDGVLNLLLK